MQGTIGCMVWDRVWFLTSWGSHHRIHRHRSWEALMILEAFIRFWGQSSF